MKRCSPGLPLPGLPLLVLPLLVAPTLLAQAPLAAQVLPPVEEEDLEESEGLAVEEVQAPAIDEAELQSLVLEAETLFASADRPAALPLYGHLLGILEAARETGGLGEDSHELLLQVLLRRGEIYLELGGPEMAADTLARILELDPALRPGTEQAGPELIAALDELRSKSLGEINLILEPYDARVSIDGAGVTALDGSVWAAAGPRLLRIERAGYAPLERQIDIKAGRAVTLELTLERTSAILRLNTRPVGAEVRLDGVPFGTTSGTAEEGFLPQGAAALYRREEFSEELVLDAVEPGLRVLEVRKPGFRSYRMELRIDEAIDYQMPPVVLEPQSGQLVFDDFPLGATIRVDGDLAEPDVPGVSRPRVTLPPGEYHITVTAGKSRMFSTRLQLSDRQTMEVQVKLRPGLAFLGVLGGEPGDKRNLKRSLLLRLGESERWALIDRSPEAPAVLERLGVDGLSLRAAASGESPRGIDWRAVQAGVDQQVPGLLYVLAAIDEDLLGRQATVWIWGAAPSPPRPDRLPVELGNSVSLLSLREALDASVQLRRPSLGAVVVDSGADPYPVIVHTTPAGPAEAAELLPGDVIFGVNGTAVEDRSALEERILAAESGESIELATRRGTEMRAVRVRLASSPWVLAEAPAPGRDQPLESIAFADLALKVESADDGTRWLLHLDQALILVRAGELEGAVGLLRRIRAPQTSHGVGQATVDYHLGLALAQLGPEYLDEARKALERAAALPEARRYHADGAWLAPRAKARLRALGGQ